MTIRWRELLTKDHEITERVLVVMQKAFVAEAGPPVAMVAGMLDYLSVYVDQCHNMKEEKALFPLIEKRGVPRQGGPLAVMLQEHEQARGLLARLAASASAVIAGNRGQLEALRAAFAEYASSLKDHFWKENDILYPLALQVMEEGDDQIVVEGIEKVESALGHDTRRRYYAVAADLIKAGELEDLSYGLERNVLAAILNSLPIELSFVDDNDTVRYFSHEHGDKIFGRTRGAIGTKVQHCHPQKSVHVVNQILAGFKAGKREVAEFWIDLGPRKIHIRYWPVRDTDGRYLGCLETVQDVSAIQKLVGQRRLLDTVAIGRG